MACSFYWYYTTFMVRLLSKQRQKWLAMSRMWKKKEKSKTNNKQERSILPALNFVKLKKCRGQADKKIKNFVEEIQKRGSRKRSLISSASRITQDMTKLVSV